MCTLAGLPSSRTKVDDHMNVVAAAGGTPVSDGHPPARWRPVDRIEAEQRDVARGDASPGVVVERGLVGMQRERAVPDVRGAPAAGAFALRILLGDGDRSAEVVHRLVQEHGDRADVTRREHAVAVVDQQRSGLSGDQVRILVLVTSTATREVAQEPHGAAAARDVGDHRLPSQRSSWTMSWTCSRIPPSSSR